MEPKMINTSTTPNKMTATAVPADALADIDVLARQIDQCGFECTSDDAIGQVLSISRITNGSPVLAEVLADSAEPPVVRERTRLRSFGDADPLFDQPLAPDSRRLANGQHHLGERR